MFTFWLSRPKGNAGIHPETHSDCTIKMPCNSVWETITTSQAVTPRDLVVDISRVLAWRPPPLTTTTLRSSSLVWSETTPFSTSDDSSNVSRLSVRGTVVPSLP